MLGGSANGVVSSGNKTETVAIRTTGGFLWGAKLKGGTADSSLKIYDHASAESGTAVWELATNAGTHVGDVNDGVVFTKPIICTNGIYAVLAGTAAEFYVLHEKA